MEAYMSPKRCTRVLGVFIAALLAAAHGMWRCLCDAAPAAQAHGDVIYLSLGYNARTIGHTHLVELELDRVHGIG